LIIDASVVAAGVRNGLHGGDWARSILARGGLAAPHLMPAEVTQVLRRGVSHGSLSGRDGGVAMSRLLSLPIELHPFEPFAARVWELRDTMSAYDAWYVALAEAFELPLATLDTRLAQAPGPRCSFLLPD
jgi:predicted nucleic acid-binding protein